MGQISDITRQTNIGTQEAAASVSYLAELTEQLRSSVSTFRLPDRGNDAMGGFPGMTSVSELQGGNGSQFFPPSLGPGADNNWARDFSGNFPPFPEPGNSGSLVALSARNGQFPFNNQQDFNQPSFGNAQNFGGQQSFTGQPGFGGQQEFGQQSFGSLQNFASSFDHQQDFGGQQGSNEQQFDNQYQQGFGGQQAFGNQYQHSFGGQQPFNSQPGFDDFGGSEQQQGVSDQQLGGMPGYPAQGQQNAPASNQAANLQPPNSGSLHNQQQPGQSQASRQRRQRDAQQPGQSQFGQDQTSYPNNGQFGQ
jgi:hypothetical protein